MKNTLIKTISIPVVLQEFLDENPDLSLSKIAQSKIIEIMENRRHRFDEENRLKKQIVFLNKKLEMAGEDNALLEKKIKEHGV